MVPCAIVLPFSAIVGTVHWLKSMQGHIIAGYMKSKGTKEMAGENLEHQYRY